MGDYLLTREDWKQKFDLVRKEVNIYWSSNHKFPLTGFLNILQIFSKNSIFIHLDPVKYNKTAVHFVLLGFLDR